MKFPFLLSFILGAFICFSSCSASANDNGSSVKNIRQQTPQNPSMKKIGDLKPTFYWVAVEEVEDPSRKTNPLLDMDGNVLARVSARFNSAIRLEGTGKMLDGRILNYAGRVTVGGKEEIRYLVCPPDAPYGYGVDKIPLVPFRSVAVDPSVVPMGSKVFIPAAVGMVLPDGSIHDGYFMAVDIGDAIKSKRIDMFTAYGDQSEYFVRAGIENMRPMEVFMVQ